MAWVAIFILQKPLFFIFYREKLPEGSALRQCLQVIRHGLTLDLSMAGYLTCVPALLLIASVWIRESIVKRTITAYFIIASLAVAVAITTNIGLYEYWGFPLDATPIFYFLTSPADAMASITAGMAVAGTAAIVVITAAVAWTMTKIATATAFCCFSDYRIRGRRSVATAVLTVLTALLFLPIRGGVTVSTTNTGSAYFSDKPILNHAAVNPMFSFMESVSHQEDFGSQYRFMEPEEADRIFASLTSTSSEGTTVKITKKHPDIYLIIMESFSMKLWETDAVPNLKRVAKQGLFFTNFYANSFRTDRGLVAILGGFPAQPTMSIMKYPKKTAKLPSIAHHLRREGYALKYYYGGDANFTNMRSYLVGQGFEDIVSDVDFPVEERLSKWGVPDDKVFARLLADLKGRKGSKPMLRVLQTSSSHEPFDVPYHRLKDERLNAFAYTDSCVGNFINRLKASKRWENSLVILVPDHQGCWPKGIESNDLGHYRIPMIWTGGAIASPEEIGTIASQQDLAATLLGQLGINHDDMLFSKDIFCPAAPHFAFFTLNDLFGMASESNILIHDNKSKKITLDTGKAKGENLEKGKAYLQKLYDYIAAL